MSNSNLLTSRMTRKVAMQALYQWSIAGGEPADIEAQYKGQDSGKLNKEELEYFSVLFHGVIEHVLELDQHIASVSRIPIKQLSKVELALVRLGTFELSKQADAPVALIVNEAIELAKVFGSEKSFRYINAVLDKLAKKLRAEKPVEDATKTQEEPVEEAAQAQEDPIEDATQTPKKLI